MMQTSRGLQNVCSRCRSKLQAGALTTHRLQLGRFGYTTSAEEFLRRFHEEDGADVKTVGNGHPPKNDGAQTWKGSRRAKLGGGDRSDALAIFNSVVQEQRKGDDVSVAPVAQDTAGAVELLKSLDELESMMRKGTSTAECFAFFDSKISGQITGLQEDIPRVVKNRTRLLLGNVIQEKEKDCLSKDLPTVSRISQLQLEYKMFQPSAWARLTLHLISHICRISTSPADYPSIESYENGMARRDALLLDLWGSWKALSMSRFTASRSGNVMEAVNEFRYHPVDEREIRPFHKRRLSSAFTLLFPHYKPQSLIGVSQAAIATWMLFTDAVGLRGHAKREATVFTNSVLRILQLVPPQYEEMLDAFSQYSGVGEYFKSRWPPLAENLHQKNKYGTTRLRLGTENRGTEPDRRRWKDSSELLHRQLGQALKSRNLGLAKQTWTAFWGDSEMPSDDRKAWLLEHAELFNYFILVYMGIRHPGLAVEVWNSMEKAGIKPSLMSWTSMMEGCRRSKNLAGLNAVWNKLIASGTKLDVPIWTARISTLIDLGDVDGGLQALNEMARRWKERNKPGNEAVAVAPTIEPVNAALAGLLRHKKMSVAKGVLAWAGKQGIQPDIITFNTLLRPMVREGKAEEVDSVFEAMKTINVEADVATYTILLDGALSSLGDREPEDQIAVVERILNDMKAAGLEANMLTYGKMIYLLLQEGRETTASVNAVLSHVWLQGLELSSHIYTMLAEHHFTRDPPRPEIVTELIESRRLRENPEIDRVFWERVIKGYCQVGDTAKAWELYRDIDSTGAIVTYSTMYELLNAFVQDGNREAATQLMDRVLKKWQTAMAEGAEDNTRHWKHRFWHLAERSGLLPYEVQKSLRAAAAV